MMKSEQYNRMIQQISSMMKLSQPATQTLINYFQIFKQSDTHQFPHEIMVASCIFLVSKVFQETHKIRDILNVIYIATTLYQKAQSTPQTTNYLSLKYLLQHHTLTQMLPHYDLQDYNKFKAMILDAEQHLLRIINFDVSLASINSSKFKQLLLVLRQIQGSQWFSQLAVNVYNDLMFSQLQINIPGIMYFVASAAQVTNNTNVLLKQQDWQSTFQCSVKQMSTYAQKIAEFYQTYANHQKQHDQGSNAKGQKEEIINN